MGGRGSAGLRNTSKEESFVERSVTDLYDVIAYKEGRTLGNIFRDMREKFNIPNANDKQLEALRNIIKGINEYDRGYDEEKTPYNITYFKITQSQLDVDEIESRKSLGMHITTQPLQVSISTEPNDSNAYIRMLDAKDHYTLIGANGGLYTYTKNGKKKTLKEFDVSYGKRR